MRQTAASKSEASLEAPIELVGEIDQDGIDALAELLIAAARRHLQDERNAMTTNEAKERDAE